MQLISVNVGSARELSGRSYTGTTGIFKIPVAGSIRIGELGLDNDAVLDTRHHGGPDQAAYLYRQEDYDWWSSQLGRPLTPGTFGDNLTVSGLPEASLPVGSRLAFSEVLLEVTAPRIPCNTLAERMGDAKFVKRFVQAERPGFYCRVLQPGSVRSGEKFDVAPGSGAITTLGMFRAAYRKLDRAELERFLAAPIDARSRDDYERQLARLPE